MKNIKHVIIATTYVSKRMTRANPGGGWRYKNCTLSEAEKIKRKNNSGRSGKIGEIKDYQLVIEYRPTKTANDLTILQKNHCTFVASCLIYTIKK